jgi:hypothetical protein
VNSTIRLSAGLVAAALLATACGGRSLTAPPAPIPALSAAAGTTGAMSLAYPAYPEPGRVEYRVEGTLPSLSAHAAAYRLGHETTEGQVAHLATALGVNGTVSADPMGWTVTGPAAGLHVTRVAGLPWSLSPSSGSGVSSSSGCAVAMPAGPASAPGSAPSSAGKAPLPAPAPACPSPTAVPGLSSRADAEQRARSVLSLAGLDLSGATVESSGGITEWLVSVTPAVGGVRMTGAGWSLALGAHGSLQWASGWLASPASAGDYPLVGVQAGFDRLRRGGTWIVRGGPGPMPMMGMMGGVSGAPNAVSPGSPVQAEPPVAPVPPPHSDVVAPAPPVGAPCPPGAKCSAPRGEPAPCPRPRPRPSCSP